MLIFQILIGTGVTILFQSSSIFISTLIPMAGNGVLYADTIYPLFLGSNLGTTFTSLVAAAASSDEHENDAYKIALQAFLVHFFFNFFGILLFYPIPFLR